MSWLVCLLTRVHRVSTTTAPVARTSNKFHHPHDFQLKRSPDLSASESHAAIHSSTSVRFANNSPKSRLSLWKVQRNVTSPAGRGTRKNYARNRKEVIIFTPLKHSRRKAKEEKLNHVRTGAEKFSPPIVVICLCPAPVNNSKIARLSPRGGQRKGCWPKSASESS